MRIPLLLFLPLLLAAQATDAPTVTVKGRVLDSKTRRPQSGARLRFSRTSEDARLAESDGDGRFRLDDVAPGRYRVTALRSGYQPAKAPTFEINREEDEQEIVVELNRSVVIAGRVLDHLGRPVVAAKVTAYQRSTDARSLESYWYNQDMRGGYAHTFYMGVADDRGEYRLWGMPKGEYVLLAKPTSPPGPPWVLSFEAAPTFYPNSPTLDEATRLDLGWGEVREGVDIRLGPPAATLQTVRTLSGAEPCTNCMLTLFRKGREADVVIANAIASGRGEITLKGFPPGEYIAGAAARARHGPRASGLQDFVVSTDGDRPFVVRISDPVAVRGRVVFENPPDEIPEPPDQNPMFRQFNVVRTAPRARDREKIFLSCIGEPAAFYGEGEDRFFEVTANPGLCRLTVSGPPDSYVAGMALDGRPLERPEILIPPGRFPGLLTVRIRFDSGHVSGRVEDADVDTWVYLLPSGGNEFGRYHPVRVEADGSFRVKAPPGLWNIIAGRSPNSFIALETLRLAQSSAGKVQRVEIQAGETTVLVSTLRVLD